MPYTRPSLTVSEAPGVVRLELVGISWGEGESLQDAADDLIRGLLGTLLAMRSGVRASSADDETRRFFSELDEIVAAGGDIRRHVFA